MISNAEKYNFNDFSHKHYAEIIKAAKKNYQFVEYSNSLMDNSESLILCRHDVDFSVDEAVNLAIIENKLGVVATYFVLLHSDNYNVFEKRVKSAFQRILSLGHRLELHFDPVYYDIENKVQLEEYLLFEKSILEKVFNIDVKVFSFHNPSEVILKFDEWSYAGLINTYANDFRKNFAYCSDSNGYWRFKRMFDLISLEAPKKLQILTHPEWWTKEIQSPKGKIWSLFDERAERNKTEYIQSLENAGRRIIDW